MKKLVVKFNFCASAPVQTYDTDFTTRYFTCQNFLHGTTNSLLCLLFSIHNASSGQSEN